MYQALKKYGKNILLFDIGTAITLDVIKDGIYKSGYIFPGIDLQKSALIKNASMLKDFNFREIKNLESVKTVSQINNGILLGTIGVIEIYINQYVNYFDGKYQIIITGGASKYLQKFLKTEMGEKKIIFDYNLMYEGLKKIGEILWGM